MSRNIHHRIAWSTAGVLWALTAGLPALADDTELFIGTNLNSQARPNILFVIDNSISMDTLVPTQTSYDSSVTYASGGCAANRVYWRLGPGSPPDCNTSRWFDMSALKCKAALDAFTTAGYYQGLMGQYNNANSAKQWEALSSNRKSNVVECADDAGIHGDGVDTTRLYARNGSTNNGYWGTFAQRITWGQSPLDSQQTVLFSGNYMNWKYGPTTNRTRLDVVKEVANGLLDSVNNVNVGLVYFNDPVNFITGSQGGRVAVPIGDVATNRATMKSQINALTATAFTPLSETLYESALYYAGRTVDYGNPGSVASSRDPSNTNLYQSPIAYSCQKNFTVILTDGEPTRDDDADTKIKSMQDGNGGSFGSLVGNTCDVETYPAGFSPTGGQCLDDLAEFLHDGDFSPLPGRQNIDTYTVGFTVDLPVLAETASRGGGSYYTANDTASLAGALQQIVTSILTANTTFTAPTVAVNAFNRTQNLSDLFISVFRPSARVHWPGNLKKYRLTTASTIVDVNGNAAIDPATGFFKDSAQDFWSATVDGQNVSQGGAAQRLPTPATRKVYTNISGNTLTASSNRVSLTNTALTNAVLLTGGPGDPTRDQVINFINGIDVPDTNQNNNVTEARNQLGDPLHSQPVSIVYGPGLRDGLILSATNDGSLHAFDLSTGQEHWSFIPQEFLDDQTLLYKNDAAAVKHYGIDGDIAVQVVADNDGVIEPGEQVYAFFGMRRGGNFYYGLDISNPDQPRVLWRIDGATLPGLGQSWSTPVPTRINVSGATQNADKLALVIGGGYEPDQDNAAASTDIAGNSIYIVDSVSGNLLWHGSKNGTHKSFNTAGRAMDYSIPSDIRVIDLDGNGTADRMYAADMGGQVWRFDISNGQTASNLVTGGVIAQLGAAPSLAPAVSDVRRFYYAPDVAVVNTRQYDFIHVGIGSGSRGHPLSTLNNDRFYALRDYGFGKKTQAQFDAITPIRDADLVPITTVNTNVPQGSPGWRLDLTGGGQPGEKVLAESRTFNNEIVFTTFRPSTAGNSCTPQLGTNRVYQMSVINGTPVNNLDGSADPDNLTMSDLFIESEGAPLPAAQLIFLDGDVDGDGIPDAEDDLDGDGIPDSEDNDIDGDGLTNDVDDDDDNDGILDVDEQNTGGGATLVIGLMSFPAGYRNDPVRTFWSQESLDD